MKVLLFMLLVSLSAKAACPDLNKKEEASDCPWAEVTKKIVNEKKSCDTVFKKDLNFILAQLRLDKKSEKSISLWGEAKNFDDNAKAVIVDPIIINCLAKKLNIHDPLQKQEGFDSVHAGLQHTYSYLFSNLMTPYGYKRARWTKDDIQVGLGLTPNTLTPLTKSGAFLTNATYIFAKLAFKDKPELVQELEKTGLKNKSLSPELIKFKAEDFEIKNLIETSPNFVIHTTFVKFKTPPTSTQNSHLLIYWVEDLKKQMRYFISGFPVEAGFVEKALDPKNLGDSKPISARYNAWLPALNSGKEALLGKREVSN
ncbi:MAG: hypothetical protein ACXWQQ_14375 [Pseudobdellovibrio sp.]